MHHPEVSLVVAGAPGWMPKRDARLLDRPGVIAVGSVPDSTLDALYEGAEVVLSASIYEGFGLTVLEGLAHGRPVVATKIPPHCEIAAGTARLFPPGDVDALVEAIDEVLDDPAAATERGDAGRERARSFDIGSTADAHIAVYERAVFGGV
jgi:glycosyltransferase involved in cell wall biosynthesis